MLERILLAPYYLTLKIRHALYDSGVFEVHTCKVPTICVGNIAAGGTGKTPHTEMILRTLLSSEKWHNHHIAVLSRGHKRKSNGFQQILVNDSAAFAGDEPLQIKRKFPEVTVAVDRTRVEGCDFLLHPETVKTSRKARKCEHKDIENLSSSFSMTHSSTGHSPHTSTLSWSITTDLQAKTDFFLSVISGICPRGFTMRTSSS